MSRVLALANLDFEYELSEGENYRPKEPVLRMTRRWRSVLRLLPEARDAMILDPDQTASGERLVSWGVTPQTLKLARTLGIKDDFPSLKAVSVANDKQTSHEIERTLGVALPFSRVVKTVGEVEEAIRECPHDWVLKHPFGVSARERLVGRAGVVIPATLNWARSRLDLGLLFEPWVEQARSYSMHFQVNRSGKPFFLGWCELLTDAGGVYRGNRVLSGTELDPTDFQTGLNVCQHLAARGYWGLVGIDCLRGFLGETAIWRPLVEINARCSFGRLTLALAEWMPMDWSYTWWHPRKEDAPTISSLPALGSMPVGSMSAGAYALPLCADPESASGTVVLTAPTQSELQRLEPEVRLQPDPPGWSQRPAKDSADE